MKKRNPTESGFPTRGVTRYQTRFLHLLVFVFLVLSIHSNSSAQSSSGKIYTVPQIRQIYLKINEYKKYKQVSIEDCELLFGQSTDNGCSLTGYYKVDSLKKMVEWIGLSNRVNINEYYFQDNHIVLVLSLEKLYKVNDVTGEMDNTRFDKTFADRYYFSNDKLIKTILSNKEHEMTEEQAASEFLATSKKYLSILHSRHH